MVKNPNWQEADQLAIYKRGRGVELGVRRQVRRPNTLDHAASESTTPRSNEHQNISR